MDSPEPSQTSHDPTMEQRELPPLMRIPAELRLLIYQDLLDDCGSSWIEIRHKSPTRAEAGRVSIRARENHRRSSYRIFERPFRRSCYKTTYAISDQQPMHTSVMAVNKQIHRETSHALYALHGFSFDVDIEAVAPFLSDLTPSARDMIRRVSIRRESLLRMTESDRMDWAGMCKELSKLTGLKHLRIVVEGGRPPAREPLSAAVYTDAGADAASAPLPLSVSDLRLLRYIEHDSTTWMTQMEGLKNLEVLDIVPDIRYMSRPKTSDAKLYASFSASMDSTFIAFLREDFELPAEAAPGPHFVTMDRSHVRCGTPRHFVH